MFDIVPELNKVIEERIKTFEHKSNWVSLLGDDCVRKLVYFRTIPHEASLHSIEIQYIMENGEEGHELTIRRLRQTGRFKIRGVDIPLPAKPEFEKYNLGGKIDVRVEDLKTGEIRDGEIKTISEIMFKKINHFTDLAEHPYYKKYITQLGIYLWVTGAEEGFFLITSRIGHKEIWVTREMIKPYALKGLKNAETIEKHLKKNTLPKRNITDACLQCPFFHICLPDISSLGGKMIPYTDKKLINTIKKYLKIKTKTDKIKDILKEEKELIDRIKISIYKIIKDKGRQTGSNEFKIHLEKYIVKAKLVKTKKTEYVKINDIVEV